MKIEKFLEKVSQDERVEKITYEKGWGYRISLKEGYGILNETKSNVFVGNMTYFSCKENQINSYIRSNTQNGLMRNLDKVVKYDLEQIEKTNKKNQLEALKDYVIAVEQNVRFANYDIQRAEEKKKSLERTLDSAIKFKEKLEKEVEAYGTAEQL